MRAAALRKGEELIAAARHEAATIRDTIDDQLADKRAAAERDAAAVRAAAEREVTQLKAAAQREHDEIVLAARRKAEEIRVREQRLLEESEALRTQSEADLEIELAARREQAERAESERHAEAVVATRKLVEEAERRAATADRQAAAVAARNEQARREADERARQLVDDAQRDADRVLADVRAAARQVQAEADAEADRRRAAAQRELDELTKQKDEVSRHLAQMRQLVGSLLPEGLELPEGANDPWITALTRPTGGHPTAVKSASCCYQHQSNIVWSLASETGPKSTQCLATPPLLAVIRCPLAPAPGRRRGRSADARGGPGGRAGGGPLR